MKFDISAASLESSYDDKINMDAIKAYVRKGTIEINTLEELFDFIKEIRCEIIINMDFEPDILIHNYYL